MPTPDPAARRREVIAAGHRDDPASARAGLTDADASVRAAAIGALERLGRLEPGDLDAALVDASVTVRRRAIEACAGRPGDAPPSLLAALGDPDATIVEVAAWASGERQPPEAGVVRKLAELATDHPDALVREAAVAALGAVGDEAGRAAILAALADKATVRRRAVLALAPFDGPDVEAALAAALEDRDWQVRQAAEDLSR
ncbi:MAG: HEAT repeat domain-containing protein [Acidimicrobiales bacterium]